jgi:hypothetical protein
MSMTLCVPSALVNAPRTRLLRLILEWAIRQPDLAALRDSSLNVTLVDAESVGSRGDVAPESNGYTIAYIQGVRFEPDSPSDLFVAYGQRVTAGTMADHFQFSGVLTGLACHCAHVTRDGTHSRELLRSVPERCERFNRRLRSAAEDMVVTAIISGTLATV